MCGHTVTVWISANKKTASDQAENYTAKKVMSNFVEGNLAFFGIGTVGKISIFLVPRNEF